MAFAPRGRITGAEIPLNEIANQTNTFGSNFIFPAYFTLSQFMMQKSEVRFIIQNDEFSICKVLVLKCTATFRYYFELPGWIFRCSFTFTIGNIIFRPNRLVDWPTLFLAHDSKLFIVLTSNFVGRPDFFFIFLFFTISKIF